MRAYNMRDLTYDGPKSSIIKGKSLWIKLYCANGAIIEAVIPNSLLLDLSQDIKVELRRGGSRTFKVQDLSRVEVISIIES